MPAAAPAWNHGAHEAPAAQAPVEDAPAAQAPVEDVMSVEEWNKAPARDRGVVLMATLAGFLGGALSGAGVSYLLG